MSDYSQITDFSDKDALTTGDPEKVISGADMDGELAAISTAIASKIDEPGSPSTNDFLKWNGSAWAATADPETGWAFAAQYTPSATAQQDITDLSQTSDHLFVLRRVLPATDGAILSIRTSADAGGSPTFDTGASNYFYDLIGRPFGGAGNAIVTGSSVTATSILATISGSGNVASTEVGVSGAIEIYNPADTTGDTNIHINTAHRDTTNTPYHQSGWAMRNAAAVVQAIRFYFSSGNITSGTIDHYTRTVQ